MRITVALFLLLGFFMGNAQVDPEIISSPVFKHKKPRMLFNDALGEQNGAYYVLYNRTGGKAQASALPSLTIKIYDKEDMSLIKSANLIDINNKSLVKKYKDYRLYDFQLSKNGVQLFFIKDGKKSIYDVYSSTYDLNLNPIMGVEKVSTFDWKERKFSTLTNDSYPNTILIKSNYPEGDEDLFLEFKEIDKNFELVRRGKVRLPYKPSGNSGGLFNRNKQASTRALFLSDQGKIITSLKVLSDKSAKTTKKGRKKRKLLSIARTHISVLVIDPKTEEVADIPIKLNNSDKTIKDYTWNCDGEKVYATGFYSDKRNSRYGNNITGVFKFIYNVESNDKELFKLADFPEEFLYRINNQNTIIRSDRKKERKSKNGDMVSDIRIADVITNVGTGNSTVYCEAFKNYSTTTTDQNGNTQTTYHSIRGTIFYFVLNNAGEIEFYNTIRRKIKYSSSSSYVWYADYTFVHRGKDGKNDYLFYRTVRIYNERDKSDTKGSKAKWKKTRRNFVIATVNLKTGNNEINFPQEYSKKDRKNLPLYIGNFSESKGNLYSHSVVSKMRTSRLITAIVGVPLMFIPTVIVFLSPKSYYQKVQLNRIEIQDDSEGSDY